MQLHTDFSLPAISKANERDWIPSPLKGVDRKMLERNGDEVARATTIVRYAPGSFFSPHVHTGGEEFIVLEGIFSDEHGDYPAGMYVRNPVGSKHRPYSKDGCTIMVKLWQYPAEDQDYIRINLNAEDGWKSVVEGVQVLQLHKTEHEHVEAFKLAAGKKLLCEDDGGVELFFLEGAAEIDGERYGPGDWLRFPSGGGTEVLAIEQLLFWRKKGHLKMPPPLPHE